jgi:hypothetical protein
MVTGHPCQKNKGKRNLSAVESIAPALRVHHLFEARRVCIVREIAAACQVLLLLNSI